MKNSPQLHGPAKRILSNRILRIHVAGYASYWPFLIASALTRYGMSSLHSKYNWPRETVPRQGRSIPATSGIRVDNRIRAGVRITKRGDRTGSLTRSQASVSSSDPSAGQADPPTRQLGGKPRRALRYGREQCNHRLQLVQSVLLPAGSAPDGGR